MERKDVKDLSQRALKRGLDMEASAPNKTLTESNSNIVDPGKVQNPRTKWLRDAKWGLFTHYMAHVASYQNAVMSKEEWVKKVNSFDVKQFGDQLSALKVPYFFITIGQAGEHFCSPNKTLDRIYGPDTGARPERDLVADIAAELIPRGIKMCVYLPSRAQRLNPVELDLWLEVITEWSERWGKSISAWWFDGAATISYEKYQAYFNAAKAGNKDALVATKLSLRFPTDKVLDDYTFGESGFLLEVSSTHYRNYRPETANKMQMHFLSFLGEFWGVGEPRFPLKMVTGWTQHINNMGGTVTWDIPVTNFGTIPDKVYSQLEAISRQVNSGK